MRAYRVALGVTLLAAVIAGCSPLSRFRGGGAKVETGSLSAPQAATASQERAESADAPSLITFEATTLTGSLTCTGAYNPLENQATFTAAVVCSDGRTGEVTADRSGAAAGAGTLVLSGGVRVSVAVRRLTAAERNVPAAAPNQLPAPDASTYVN